MTLNETHDPSLKSWVASANDGQTDFPIQNLPFASFRRRGSQEAFRPGVAIGQAIVDLGALRAARPFEGDAARALEACADTQLNTLMALGPQAWSALRLALSRALREGAAQRGLIEPLLVPQAEAEFTTPARIGDYTDFYISLHHATAVGKQFRPDNPLLPNYKWVPIGYHGRASSIGVEQRFPRPVGQQRPAAEGEAPLFGPCKRLDYELELSIFVGQGNAQGDRIALASAEQHVFGLGILNDWSARDIQAWEYQPLGPFLSKNFASTISPWIVTLEALEPFRTQWKRPEGDPQPLPYLASEANRAQGAFDVQMEVLITTEASRARQAPPARLSRSNFRDAYWNVAQLITHHTVNGCNLQAGDMLGTGTLSGPGASEAGSLLELSQGGKTPVALPWGETRTFLEDGDQIIIRAECVKPGYPRIGFGQCAGTVTPARL
ncbi:fumarylacetoacetase [Bordetella pseudohinzii]|uniref:fumarylacetoacetase n=1 Tax=Bordetella pseudohinzii TaxID=1331258 RepID=A0A0J6BZQ5_9BORD|nr:fumarylacetoacetase [Bordetella pseudohinzii]ANY17624.1 fumarylacetoacetase [Bordetella pseudohinzii]KMM24001.1 fumarylacetoacetase [Bordetella pseudohinzii]KXA76013.1 fumarylacetoacetase [Bordetella pseudohinzii]KXA81838.1 fumarylacetoacetase [Bordetella pseudohinzii]CUI75347.1 2-keto-4-pentenoate hydratase/2-oxohepta-3-ene-1%2C7-dioic acid hydratase (catechol pathway) [Bordetella pseudohinzii]